MIAKRPSRDIPPVGLSVNEVLTSTGLARATLYREINAGRLTTYKVGRRRVISPQALAAWVAKLEKAAGSA
jgi:excisionase family DNA binding protein